jgi:L-ornithine Nalpha-acyltransferase
MHRHRRAPELGPNDAIANPDGAIVIVFSAGRYRARLGRGTRDLAQAMVLRQQSFRAGAQVGDQDRFDAGCDHLVVEVADSGAVVAYCRLGHFADGSAIRSSYAAQFYDLTRLTLYRAPMMEIGRFCLTPDLRDPDILRMAWGALARLVDQRGVGMLFGCTSLPGTDGTSHARAFAALAAGHLAPKSWQPGRLAPEVHDLAGSTTAPDPAALPPLLRSYLALGAWVSDHAVIDRDLNTVHLFTGLEVAAIPPARARLLRATLAQGHQ